MVGSPPESFRDGGLKPPSRGFHPPGPSGVRSIGHRLIAAAFSPTLEGLSAIGLIGGLSYRDEEGDGPMDESKVSASLQVLAHDPERVGCGLVTDPDDPRCGCFRASPPQRAVAIRRPGAK